MLLHTVLLSIFKLPPPECIAKVLTPSLTRFCGPCKGISSVIAQQLAECFVLAVRPLLSVHAVESPFFNEDTTMQLGISNHRHVVPGENDHTAAVPAAGQVCMATSLAAAFMLAVLAFSYLHLAAIMLSPHSTRVLCAGVVANADS